MAEHGDDHLLDNKTSASQWDKEDWQWK